MDLNKHRPNDSQKYDAMILSFGLKLNQAKKCVNSKFDNHGISVIICLHVNDILIYNTDFLQV